MAPEALSCKECEATLPARGALRMRAAASGPLEVSYDFSRPRPGGGAAEDPGRLARASGATRTSCRSPSAPRDPLEPGLTPLIRADRLAERLGLGERLDQERRREPHPLVQGPRRRGRAGQGARAGLRDRRLRIDGQPRQRRRRARRRRRPRLLRLRARRPRGAEAARHRRLRHAAGRRQRATTTTSTASAPQLCETRPWAFVNVNLRPYYSQGSKTLAFETVEQLGWSLPDRVVVPDRLGLAVHEARPRVRGVARPRPGRGRAADLQRRPGRGLQPGRHGVRRGLGGLQAAAPRHDRQEPRDRRPRRRRPTRSSSRARPGGSIDSVTDDEIRDGIRLLAETTGIFTETAGGVTIAVLGKLAERGDIDPAERVVAYITGEGLKTLDATRDELPDARDRADARGVRGRAASPGAPHG